MIDIQSLKPKIKQISEKYGLDLVLIFGSQATGKTHKESDTDIAYHSAREIIESDKKDKIYNEILGLFYFDSLKHVDIIDLNDASPLLLKQIMTRPTIILYEKYKSIFNSLYLYALRIYEEAKPLFDIKERYVNRKILEYSNA